MESTFVCIPYPLCTVSAHVYIFSCSQPLHIDIVCAQFMAVLGLEPGLQVGEARQAATVRNAPLRLHGQLPRWPLLSAIAMRARCTGKATPPPQGIRSFSESRLPLPPSSWLALRNGLDSDVPERLRFATCQTSPDTCPFLLGPADAT